jgi:tRNA (guanine-N7-)-methyltransferase
MNARRHKQVSEHQASHSPIFYPSTEIQAKRTIIEIGPGRGDFLFHLAKTNSDALIIGVEIKRKRIDKLVQRIEKLGLTNVKLIQTDARVVFSELFQDASIDEIHIQFPDPWPKNKHAKNRTIQIPFLKECSRVLKKGGTWNFATDSGIYAQHVAGLMPKVDDLENCFEDAIAENLEDAYPTFFSMKWKKLGRTLTYQKYRKR